MGSKCPAPRRELPKVSRKNITEGKEATHSPHLKWRRKLFYEECNTKNISVNAGYINKQLQVVAAAHMQIQKLKVQLICQGRWQKPTSQTKTDAPANETGDISTTGADASAGHDRRGCKHRCRVLRVGKISAAFLRTAGVQKSCPVSNWMLRTQQTYDEILVACLQYKRKCQPYDHQ